MNDTEKRARMVTEIIDLYALPDSARDFITIVMEGEYVRGEAHGGKVMADRIQDMIGSKT